MKNVKRYLEIARDSRSFTQKLVAWARNIESICGDRLLNMKTGGSNLHYAHPIGVNKDGSDFEVCAHSTILLAIKAIRLVPEDVVFVLGSGLGRAVCHFARQHVRKVVGIELETRLCESARRNAETLRGRRAEIEIINTDAVLADMSEGSVFFMFNPFGEKTLRAVLKNIEQTHNVRVDPITAIYCAPFFSHVFEEFPWLPVAKEYTRLSGMKTIIYRNEVNGP